MHLKDIIIPPLSEWPEWANWWELDLYGQGHGYFYEYQPKQVSIRWEYTDGRVNLGIKYKVLITIDWKNLLVSRESLQDKVDILKGENTIGAGMDMFAALSEKLAIINKDAKKLTQDIESLAREFDGLYRAEGGENQ